MELLDELLEIMSLDAPKSISTDAYRNYANLLLSVFHVVCRSLSELRHLVRGYENVSSSITV